MAAETKRIATNVRILFIEYICMQKEGGLWYQGVKTELEYSLAQGKVEDGTSLKALDSCN
jgi:hypothetical protein